MYMYFLGTGAGKPSLKRNVTSIALKLPAPKNEIWLFDCGEGTQHQILASPFGLHKVTNVFISHLHGDHIFGLPGFLGSRSFSTEATSLTIYGPPGIQDFVQISLKISGTTCVIPWKCMKSDLEMSCILTLGQSKSGSWNTIFPLTVTEWKNPLALGSFK